MEYMSAKEAANKWGISQRRVAVLCSENRIRNATMIGNMWLIPSASPKPVDARSIRYTKNDEKTVKPFLKWAGGKGQLLKEIGKYYPFAQSSITKYAEPFVGGGAVLFDILGKYNLKEIYISDTNADLINAYKMIRCEVDELLDMLATMQDEYLSLNGEERKNYYMLQRDRFNELTVCNDVGINIVKAALLIFLNKTCFNGLYRVNRKGGFNVPMGSYKSPLICDEKNLRAVSEKLKRVKIVCGDYHEAASFIDEHTFVYFDPPYRPLTETSSFTAYTENLFGDNDQRALAAFFNEMHKKGAKMLLSNSDPKNTDPNDDFFESIYSAYAIRRVQAVRMINSKSDARGRIKELLISNF